MTSDLDGGRPFRRPSKEKALGLSLLAAEGLATGRYLCWWMAVQQGRDQLGRSNLKIIGSL